MVLVIKNPPANAGDIKTCGFDPWVGKILWSRKWQPAPLFLPGKLHGQKTLVGYSPWGHKEADMIKQLNTQTKLVYLVRTAKSGLMSTQ